MESQAIEESNEDYENDFDARMKQTYFNAE